MKRFSMLPFMAILFTTATYALKNKEYNYVRINQLNVMERFNDAGSAFIGGGLEVDGQTIIHNNLIVDGAITAGSINGGTAANITLNGDTGSSLMGNNFTISGDGTGLQFSGLGSTLSLTGTLNVANGGTGKVSVIPNAVLAGGTTSTAPFQSIPNGTAGQILMSNGPGALPSFQTGSMTSITMSGDTGSSITGSNFKISGNSTGLQFNGVGTTLSLTGTLDVANGGTGNVNAAANELLAGGTTATAPFQSISNGTAGQILTSNGAGSLPTFQTAAASSITLNGDTGTPATGNSFTISGDGTGLQFNSAGTTLSLTGTLDVANGGTGNASASANELLAGGTTTTAPFQSISNGTAGQILTSNGAGSLPTFQMAAASSITLNGDTGSPLTGNNFTISGDASGLQFNGAGTTLSLTGTLNVANGGTGDNSFTPYAVICGGTSSTGNLQSVASVGTSGQVLTSNGAGALPTFQTGGGNITVSGDSGTISGSAITITAGNSTNHCGSTVSFSATGTSVTLNVSIGNATAIGLNAGNSSFSGNSTCFGTNTLQVDTSAGANSAFGASALKLNTTGIQNCAFGAQALFSNTTGRNNSAFGTAVLSVNTSGNSNVAVGIQAMLRAISGSNNTAIGTSALNSITTGSNNTALGNNAGTNYSGSESNNIVIGNLSRGTAGESNVIRIGGGTTANTACFIDGIYTVTATGGISVFINSSGQLGTGSSSRRYKNSIVDMAEQSSPLLRLRPVTFCYNDDTSNSQEWGLIAEEVAEIMPSLVVYDKNNDPYTVKYHNLPAILLNEMQKQEVKIERQQEEIDELKKAVAVLSAFLERSNMFR